MNKIAWYWIILVDILMVIGWVYFLWYDWRMALLTSCGASLLVLLIGLRIWYIRSRHAE